MGQPLANIDKCGTYHAMAPEVIKGLLDRNNVYKADCWQIGILLFELCHLEPPFGRNVDSMKNLEELIKNIHIKKSSG